MFIHKSLPLLCVAIASVACSAPPKATDSNAASSSKPAAKTPAKQRASADKPKTATAPKAEAPPKKVAVPDEDDLDAFSHHKTEDEGLKMRALAGPYPSIDKMCVQRFQAAFGLTSADEFFPCDAMHPVDGLDESAGFDQARFVVFGEPGISPVEVHLALHRPNGWYVADGFAHLPNSTHGDETSALQKGAARVDPADPTLLRAEATVDEKVGKKSELVSHTLWCRVAGEEPQCTTAVPSTLYGVKLLTQVAKSEITIATGTPKEAATVTDSAAKILGTFKL
ncbi:MAG: hypothetical protein AAF721_37020 [Myxococcota bacterium]